VERIESKSIRRLLVANRSEIAIRVFRAATELGISTIAVFADQDKLSLHRFKADEAYLIGEGMGPNEAYLSIDEIIRVTKLAKADAIHPGYGFLAESPEFRDACEEAGIVFIGPTAETTILERTQNGGLDLTDWLQWFLACFTRAIDGAEASGAGVLRKAEFWRAHDRVALSTRQRMMLNRCLDGLHGNLTARKWAILGKCSPASAQRDIADLVEKGILQRNPGGSKNTSYALA
jgi:hypothetical protein